MNLAFILMGVGGMFMFMAIFLAILLRKSEPAEETTTVPPAETTRETTPSTTPGTTPGTTRPRAAVGERGRPGAIDTSGPDWNHVTASYYNAGDQVQNDGYAGCTACTGCPQPPHNDEDWLVAVQARRFAEGVCGKLIEIYAYDTQRSVVVPILNVMREPTRQASDLDLIPRVARELGFTPTVRDFGSNKRVSWRFVGSRILSS